MIAAVGELVSGQSLNLKYCIEDGRIYNKNCRLKGRIQYERIYDENSQWKGLIEEGKSHIGKGIGFTIRLGGQKDLSRGLLWREEERIAPAPVFTE